MNLKGADGNANVTRYIFSGNDFSSNSSARVNISLNNESEFSNSVWLVYLVKNSSSSTFRWSVPGWGNNGDSYYRGYNSYVYYSVGCSIILKEGSGESYDRIEVVRIESSNTVDNTQKTKAIIPKDLDVTNYNAVAEHYGF